MKEERVLKVYSVPVKIERIPQIRIQGKWLRDIGYETGDEIIVKIESNGQIIITKKEE